MNIFNFDELFEYAIKEWASEIDTEKIVYYNGKYVVENLGQTRDLIIESHFDDEFEVILSSIHTSIFFLIYKSSKYLTKINRDHIRKDAVFLIFKQIIEKSISNPSGIYDKNDIVFLKKYIELINNKQ